LAEIRELRILNTSLNKSRGVRSYGQTSTGLVRLHLHILLLVLGFRFRGNKKGPPRSLAAGLSETSGQLT